MRDRALLGLAAIMLVAYTACSAGTTASGSATPSLPSPTESASEALTGSTSESPSEPAAPADPLVGRWRSERTCQELVSALDRAGLSALVPWQVGEFVSGSPKQLAQKKDICQGAKSVVHYHFFTADGRFGSLDAQGNQVDDGIYHITHPRTVDIPRGPPDFQSPVPVLFHFKITGGNRLTLAPAVTASLKHKALADPSAFSAAGWAYSMTDGPSHVWTRVACAGWC